MKTNKRLAAKRKMMVGDDLESRAIIKALLQRKNIKITELTKLLERSGHHYSHQSLLNMLNRGTFKFSFVLQVMKVLNINTLIIDEPDVLIRK